MSAATVTPLPASRAGALSHQPQTYGRDPSTYRFTVEQYERMIEAGVLGPDDKVELLEGYVVYKMPHDPSHAGTVRRIGKRLRRWLPTGWEDSIQLPVSLPASEPEPDIAVIRERADDYTAGQHPTVQDIGLLIEVTNTSLVRDQRDKARIYATAGVPHYWIVNLPDRRLEVYSAPAGQTYTATGQYTAGQDVPLVLDGVTVAHIPAADLLP